MIKFNSLKVQISILLIAIILALNILTLILAHNIVKSEFNTLLKSRGENILTSINSTLEFSLNSKNSSFLESSLSSLSERKDILYLKVYDISGAVFTEIGKIETADTLPAEIMNTIKERKTISPIKEINNQKLLDCFFPVYGGMRADKVIGVFRVGISLQESFAVTKRLSSALIKILLAITIVALLATLELLNYFFRPLNKLRENLKNIAEGRADTHVRISEKFLTAESKELAASFNQFVDKLEKDKDAIRQVAERISAQAEELSASAEEMTASSEEVSSTMEQ
ncbi:MAG: methyl-accepting chemotaxis protein, partial [candidate division WOR-3 bacterium]